ncbi:hypothetical protein [Frankia gtarii]|uniref:hypothetical protein n=1 Tax=Frankia gtarii TaxID=2950102 RepID=UPI0021BFFF53|nr:hypothetical protein [Frankia gtarii]
MPKRLFNVLIMIDEERFDETVRFLAEVVGMGEPQWSDAPGTMSARMTPGWPADVDTRRVVIGAAPGVIELKAIPSVLRGTIASGVASIGFATADVERYAQRSASAGLDVGEVLELGGMTLASVMAGGQNFAFVCFPD